MVLLYIDALDSIMHLLCEITLTIFVGRGQMESKYFEVVNEVAVNCKSITMTPTFVESSNR